MNQFEISRRNFLYGGIALAGGLASGRVASTLAATTLTAGQVIERIKANVGIPWREQTVDRLIAGSLDTPVTGVATIMMATLEMLRSMAS